MSVCRQPWQQAAPPSHWTSYNMVSVLKLNWIYINNGCGFLPQGYNVAPSTLAYFPASMETNIPVCYLVVVTLFGLAVCQM